MNDTDDLQAARLPLRRRGWLFLIFGLLATAALVGLTLTQPFGFDSPVMPAALALLSACTFLILRWVQNPIPAAWGEGNTKRGRLVLLVLVMAVVLFALPVMVRSKVLYALPVLAVIALLALRAPITRREFGYAAALALTAGLAGLGSGWIKDFSPPAWAALQVALVFSGLLGGWKILQHSGLWEQGAGLSRFLREGAPSALRGFVLGAGLSLPWAFGNILLGGVHDPWVRSWWQPVIAIQPGIAEEAWGRVLIVPLLYLVFRLAARPRAAFSTALILAAYWFAYLHTPMGLNGLPGTVLLGTLYALPISALCLYRDLETAVGFHFMIDFTRYLAAYILLQAG